MAMTSCLLGHTSAASCPAFGHRRGNGAAAVRRVPMYAVSTRLANNKVVSELSLEERKKEARAWISPWLSKKAGPPPAAAPVRPAAPPVAKAPAPPVAKAPASNNGNGKPENGKVTVENGYIFYSEAVLKNETLPVN